jgi:hypothetical protein
VRTDSTPTARETGRTLLLGTLAIVLLCLFILPGWDLRFVLLLGAALGAVLVYALWMSETGGAPAAALSDFEGDDPRSYGVHANPIVADALTYYAERRSMADPKGWDHVQRVVERALAAGFWPDVTAEQVAFARDVLAALAPARDTSPAPEAR